MCGRLHSPRRTGALTSARNFARPQTILQFGRVAEHRFTMDFCNPLSPFQAFGICLASLDSKIADTKGFDQLKARFSMKKADKK